VVGCKDKIQGPQILGLHAKSPFHFHDNPVGKASLKGLQLSVGSVIRKMGKVWGQMSSWCKSSGCFILTAK